MDEQRRLPVGAEARADGGVHFRVWAPRRARVEVVRDDAPAAELRAEGDGYFSGFVADAAAGTRYRLRLDGGGAFPDPVSRFQPEGPHGPSQVIDPSTFAWSDGDWRGAELPGQVFYEMHVGTFTPEGTYAAAAERLPYLAELGITCVELMPLAEFPGRFGWGYDGVDMFAPTRLYGTPDDLRAFVDQAHAVGIAVVLDVVYNHLGPDGNYQGEFSADYVTDRYHTDWGEAINYDGTNSGPVREFAISNAAYWVAEFHFDGLRLDATQNVYDASPVHVLREVTEAARAAAGERRILIIAENEPQHPRLVRPVERDGLGMDAVWNDDYHHVARVILTGHNEAYYVDYTGTPQELISAVKWGYLYQGQHYRWHDGRRGGSALDLPARVFVNYLQNHDQIANSGYGDRIHTLSAPGDYRALTALTLLAPGTPLLFQGQEFAASAPFLFFADHEPELAAKVDAGRKESLTVFPSLGTPEVQARIAHPADEATFARCKLDWSELESHDPAFRLHRDLLRLRREDPVFSAQDRDRMHGAVLGTEAFALRFLGDDGDDRLVVVNLGRDLHLNPAPEPLLAPPLGGGWRVLWSSEHPDYGALGTVLPDSADNWRIRGHALVVLAPGGEPVEAEYVPAGGDPEERERKLLAEP